MDYNITIEQGRAKPYRARLGKKYGRLHIGRFATEADAVQAGETALARLAQGLHPKQDTLWIDRSAAEPRNEVQPSFDTPVPSAPSYNPVSFPKNAVRQGETRPLVITDPNVLVLGDLHIPFHNREMLARAIHVVTTRYPHIDQVAIIGDIFNFTRLSRHPKTELSEEIDDTLEIGGAVLRTLFAPFKRAWVMPGNHDEWLARKLDTPFDLERLLGAAFKRDWPACEIKVTNLDYVYVDHPDPLRRWVIGHPIHYSGQGGKTPADIADVVQRNVMTGHNHVIGTAQSKSGNYIGIDTGHMTDPDRHQYIFKRLTKFARWTAGFSVISNGCATTYTERFTDWKGLGVE